MNYLETYLSYRCNLIKSKDYTFIVEIDARITSHIQLTGYNSLKIESPHFRRVACWLISELKNSFRLLLDDLFLQN